MKTNLDARDVLTESPRKIVGAPTNSKSSILTEPSRLPDRIYEQILERIVSGKFAVGDRLPSENQFASDHGVSRAVIQIGRASCRERVSSQAGAGVGGM